MIWYYNIKQNYYDDYNDEYTGNYESGYGNDSGDDYRDKYYTEPEEEPADDLSQRYEDEDRAAEEYLRQHEELLRRMPKKPVSYEENEIEGFEEKLGNEVKKISEEMPETGSLDDIKIDGGKTKILDEAIKEKLRKVVIIDGETQGDETSSASACEIQEQSTHEEPYQETESEDSGAYNDSYNEEKSDDSEENESPEEISTGTDTDASLPQKQDSEPAKEEPADYASESKKMSEYGDIEHYHMMIEAETPEDGLKTAIEELKYIHNEKGIKNSAARTNAAKLNERGLSQAAVDRLRGKDLIIEDAGDLSDELLDDIYDLIKNDDSGMIVVLTDTPDRLDDIIERHPALANEFDIVSEDYDEEYTDEYEEPAEEEEDYSDYSEDEDAVWQDYRILRSPEYERASRRRGKDGERKMTLERSSVTLFLPDSTEFTGKKAETNRKIVDIIGLDAGQFTQTVMIAQGEFRKLLKADTRESTT